jgi:hypothetical protein
LQHFRNPDIPINHGTEVIGGRSLVNDRAIRPNAAATHEPIRSRIILRMTSRFLTKSKRTAGKNVTLMKKGVKKKMLAKKRVTSKKKAPPKKAEVDTKADGKKTTGGKTRVAITKQVPRKSQSVDTEAFAHEALGALPGEQSGDLQGLSNVERADSESVDELLEEGNAFEADVVKGVEDAEDADEGEVRTHEVPQDDVPREYLDEE